MHRNPRGDATNRTHAYTEESELSIPLVHSARRLIDSLAAVNLAPARVLTPRSRRFVIERRPYPELNEMERAIVKVALPQESVSRDTVLEQLADEFEEEEVLDAFATLVSEHRLYRIGNRADYMMVERDLF
jgi:hypothetical protein